MYNFIDYPAECFPNSFKKMNYLVREEECVTESKIFYLLKVEKGSILSFIETDSHNLSFRNWKVFF